MPELADTTPASYLSFAAYSPDGSPRTAGRILAHVGDLFDWALSQARGAEAWNDSTPVEWDREAERFFATLQKFDDLLASDAPLAVPAERLFQGALADATRTSDNSQCCGALPAQKSGARTIHARRSSPGGSGGSKRRRGASSTKP
jgi:hypothetical protein